MITVPLASPLVDQNSCCIVESPQGQQRSDHDIWKGPAKPGLTGYGEREGVNKRS